MGGGKNTLPTRAPMITVGLAWVYVEELEKFHLLLWERAEGADWGQQIDSCDLSGLAQGSAQQGQDVNNTYQPDAEYQEGVYCRRMNLNHKDVAEQGEYENWEGCFLLFLLKRYINPQEENSHFFILFLKGWVFPPRLQIHFSAMVEDFLT